MARHHDPNTAGLPLDKWPETDREAWQQARVPRSGPFGRCGGGRRLSVHTLAKSEKGLRHWLGYLQRAGQLEEGVDPRLRLTPERLDDYFEHLCARGNADSTVVGRFGELHSAFRLMYPAGDFRWITNPNGIAITSRLDMRVRNPFTPSSAALTNWAQDLFREGLLLDDPRARCAQVRDAVIIALLSEVAPRQRALVSLELGNHLTKISGEWILNQTKEITKERNQIVLPLSPNMALMLERYLQVERHELLRGQCSRSLWLSYYGTPLSASGVVNMLWKRSLRRFGVGFSTHRFRASLTTTNALESPENAMDASVILGHKPRTSLKNYNRATAILASRRHEARLKKLRQESEAIARRAFRNMDGFF